MTMTDIHLSERQAAVASSNKTKSIKDTLFLGYSSEDVLIKCHCRTARPFSYFYNIFITSYVNLFFSSMSNIG